MLYGIIHTFKIRVAVFTAITPLFPTCRNNSVICNFIF